ncbi:erythroferrone [Phyllostomus discolor]|uniref:Erythroferrone n=1 Tax=Phyllostomus discolor TaxID=89673 RepID=A0A7E6DPR5_9CHIR|nr:erythroferrone [Phyllostomus discolor]
MASAAARPLLLGLCLCLLAAAALGARDPGAPAKSRARQKPKPEKVPPAVALESRPSLDTRPPEPTTQPALSLSPRDTWLWFLKHSDEEDGSQDRRSKPSPPKPREPCSTTVPVPLDELLEGRQKWQQLLKGVWGARATGGRAWRARRAATARSVAAAAERLRQNAERQIAERQNAERRPSAEDEEEADPSVVALLIQALNQGGRTRIVEAAFHCRLRQNVSVERRALHELGGYYLPRAEGAFYRGPGLNLTSGQYTASIPGFYAFAATLHVALPELRRPESPRPRSRLRLLICIQSRCQQNTSLETIMSRPAGTEPFTVSVNGVLFLKRRQYASVFLDNAGSSPVTVLASSQFSAVFLGA